MDRSGPISKRCVTFIESDDDRRKRGEERIV
jgi:hypothetical protein